MPLRRGVEAAVLKAEGLRMGLVVLPQVEVEREAPKLHRVGAARNPPPRKPPRALASVTGMKARVAARAAAISPVLEKFMLLPPAL
jgi:hypothetical protein